jgi:hypothetical protein
MRSVRPSRHWQLELYSMKEKTKKAQQLSPSTWLWPIIILGFVFQILNAVFQCWFSMPVSKSLALFISSAPLYLIITQRIASKHQMRWLIGIVAWVEFCALASVGMLFTFQVPKLAIPLRVGLLIAGGVTLSLLTRCCLIDRESRR